MLPEGLEGFNNLVTPFRKIGVQILTKEAGACPDIQKIEGAFGRQVMGYGFPPDPVPKKIA